MPDRKPSDFFEIKLKIPCTRPDLVLKSLEPDVKSDKYSKITMRAGKGFLDLTVRSTKIGHMKAIANAYISLVGTLEQIEKKV